MLDVCNWALKAHPLNAVGRGNTTGRRDLGDAFSNFQVLYQYPNNVDVSIHTTKVGPQFGDVCCRFIGTKGSAEAHYSGGVFINGENKWDSGVSRTDSGLLHNNRHQVFFYPHCMMPMQKKNRHL